ncbi:MAG TPA: saccharopine dehydrogenase C-terminal domain-containing protein [Planctomycetota bacterium]|nr:saccharopine dehydrogenase C-terminal domain-containing protein [Planctomycetota bacterium]
MKRIVVLGGAGAMGRITLEDLRRTARGVEALGADRELRPLRGLGVATAKVDVLDPKSLARVLRGASVLIASLPYRFNLEAMRGALAANAHYVDLGGLYHMTRKQLRLDRAFRDRKLTAVLGMGSSPGITNLLAVHAARGLDRVHAVHCQVGSVDQTRYLATPPLGFGYSPDTLLDEMTMPSAVFRGGKHRLVPPLDPGERTEATFPPPIGKLWLETTLHSEVATLPAHFADRGIREVTFRQGFDAEFQDKVTFIVKLGLASTEPVNGTTPRAILHALLARLPKAKVAGKPRRYEVLRAEVHGTRGKKRVVSIADCHAPPESGWGIGPDIDTGAPPSIVAQMLLERPFPPGVHAPEDVVPLAPFFAALSKRGMRVTSRAR